ncbi:hypothetical protein QTP88_012450 [Uroleucon formosanum]
MQLALLPFEFLNVNGEMVSHIAVPITGDGACLFNSLSYLMYGTEQIASTQAYSEPRYTVLRMRFTQNLSRGHFDVYLPHEPEILIPKRDFTLQQSPFSLSMKKPRKRRARYTGNIRKKQFQNAVKTYALHNPLVNRSAVARYQLDNPEVGRATRSRYEHTNPCRKVGRIKLPWKIMVNSGMAYNPDLAYGADKTIALGSMNHKCKYCNALKWKEETPGMCCNNGKVQFPSFEHLPEPLNSLLMVRHHHHNHFMDLIRKYNGCFQMTSFGAKKIVAEGFMLTFKVQGQVYHLVGSLMHKPDQKAQFSQMYFVGEDERKVLLRSANFPDVKPGLVTQLQSMLHEKNSYVKQFKITINAVQKNCEEFKVIILADRKPTTNAHVGRFNAPTQNKIALVIVSQQFENRDIVLQSHDNKLQRISEIHRAYDALQYPLLFCHSEDGYSINIPLCNFITKLPLEKKVSAASFYPYRIMIRQDEVNHIVYFRSLFSQFLVDMYAKIETERLNFIRNH